MVVFNGYAIVVGLLIAAIAFPLNWLAPSLFDGTYGDFVLAIIAFFVSGACELIGLRARLFWLPIWVWALIFASIRLYELWGVAGAVIGVVLVVGAIAGLFAWMRKTEVEDWANAPKELELARNLADSAERRGECFEHLDKAFMDPALLTETAPMWTHQRALLALLRPLLGDGLDTDKAQAIVALDQAYADKIADPKAKIENDQIAEVRELIALHLPE